MELGQQTGLVALVTERVHDSADEQSGRNTLVLALAGTVILALTTGLVGSPRTPGRASQIALLVLAILAALIALLDMNGAAAMASI